MAHLFRIRSLMEPPSTLRRGTCSLLSPFIPSTVQTTHQHSTSALDLIVPSNLLGNEWFQVGHNGLAGAHVSSEHPYSAWKEVACVLDLLLHLAQRDKH